MFSFLTILLPMAIILLLAAGVTSLFGYKIEQSNFIVVCSISILLILFGLLGILIIGQYFIYLLAISSLIYLIIIKYNFFDIFTPSITFLIINILVFSFLTREIGLYTHDEVSHWALSTKSMYFSNVFYKGLQGMLASTFNYFIVKSTFFAESQLYLGAWILLWSCFLLPTGRLSWKNWKRLSLYFFACYCLTGFFIKDVTFHIDELMAIMSGALIVFWALEKEYTFKNYVLLICGLLAITQIKESFGPLCSLSISLYIIMNHFIKHRNSKIKNIFWILITPIFSILGFILSLATISKPLGYFSTSIALKLPVINLLKNSKSIHFLLIGIFIALIIFAIFYRNNQSLKIKNKCIKIYHIIAIITVTISLLFIYKFSMIFLSSLSQTEMSKYIIAWRNFFYTSQGGRTNIKLIGIFILFTSFFSIYSIKKENRKEGYANAIYLLFNILLMGTVVLIAYSTGFDETGMYTDSMSWDRYTSIPFIIIYTYIIGYYILSNDIYLDNTKKLATIFVAALLVINFLPFPTTIAFARNSKDRIIFKGVQSAVKEDKDIILNNLSKDNSVFVASYIYEINSNESGDGRTKWLKYEIAPIESSWNYYSHYDSLIGSNSDDVKDYENLVKEYDYFYIQSAGPEFYEKFGYLFPSDKHYNSNALYKVNIIGESISLTPVYIDESRLIESSLD